MKKVAPALLPLVILGAWWGMSGDQACRHGRAGTTRPISLSKVRRAQKDVRDRLRWAVRRAGRIMVDAPYESGLPVCRSRSRRTVETRVPRTLVGKTIAFAPAGRMPRADFRVASSARSLARIDVDALAAPEVVKRFGVRCVPTLVKVKSEAELELVENP